MWPQTHLRTPFVSSSASLQAADSLGDLSERGRVLPELREPLVRELLVNLEVA